jgi:hypothetical protein
MLGRERGHATERRNHSGKTKHYLTHVFCLLFEHAGLVPES